MPLGAFLALAAAAVLVWSATRQSVTVEGLLLLAATTVTVTWLSWHPLIVPPNTDLSLVFVPVLVALGVGHPPGVLSGALLGLAAAALSRPGRSAQTAALEEGIALAGSVAAASWIPLARAPLGLGGLATAGIAYLVLRTILATGRFAREDGMPWGRAISVSTGSITPALVMSEAMAMAAVAVERVWLPDVGRLALNALPLLAGAAVLHVFHPYSMRGREERRVLATTAVLADAIDVKDARTGLHSQVVASLSRQMARAIGVNERLAHEAFLTGLLHDVGKVAVPDAILQKPGGLDAAEWRVMQAHVLDSAAIVQSIPGLARIAPLVRASHEHYDGSGYPDGLRGRAIPLGARLVAIVDAYHALTSDRVYRPKRSPEAALAELERSSGTQFDPELVRALAAMVRRMPPTVDRQRSPRAWVTLLRRPAFALLWGGELVSFLGDEVFFIAITLWVYTLTGSATALAEALSAGYIAQTAFSFIAGVIADRIDRRLIVAATDIGRAAVVVALPFVLPRSLPIALVLLAILNTGSVFFRAAVNALLPSLATQEELQTANALFQTTERIAEIAGGVLGAGAVLAVGYSAVMFANAASFLVSAACILAMPLAWGVGLGAHRRVSVAADLAAGLRYVWRTPFQRYFALLIVPGYLTVAFEALRAPMVMHSAHLSAEAYGVINSTLGVGKLVTAAALAGFATRWATPTVAVAAYIIAGLGIALFASAPWYTGLIAGAFVFSVGNMMTYIVNTTLVMQATPHPLLGRVLGNRQMLAQTTRLISALAIGRLADAATPQVALWVMAGVSVFGVLGVWGATWRFLVPSEPTAVLPEDPPSRERGS